MDEYRDTVEIGGTDLGLVEVSTWGRKEELGRSEKCEPWPVRVVITDLVEEATAEAYLSIEEASDLVEALNAAIERARTFPQPQVAP